MHTFFYFVTENINTSSLERLALFCSIHFLSCCYHTKNCYLLDERNHFLLLTLLSQGHLLPLPKNSGKRHLTSLTSITSESRMTLWGREEGRPGDGNSSLLTKNWCLDKLSGSMGTKWQRHKFLKSSFSFYYTTLTSPLITKWSKLQTVESSKITIMIYMAIRSHFNHVKNNYQLIKYSWLCKS